MGDISFISSTVDVAIGNNGGGYFHFLSSLTNSYFSLFYILYRVFSIDYIYGRRDDSSLSFLIYSFIVFINCYFLAFFSGIIFIDSNKSYTFWLDVSAFYSTFDIDGSLWLNAGV